MKKYLKIRILVLWLYNFQTLYFKIHVTILPNQVICNYLSTFGI